MFKYKDKIVHFNLPTHIAFIMDGNRRWATERGLNKMMGHRQGAVALKNIISTLTEIEEIKYVSFFGFSTENWNREKKEIDGLFELARKLVEENEDQFYEKGIKFVSMGDVSKFPKDLQDVLIRVMNKTKNNTNMTVNLALNYGGRDDIVYAVNKLIKNGAKEITEEDIKQNLYSAGSPDIDLLVRTSGEQRVSNFMLYQMAYSEFYFPKVHWPAFDDKQLYLALKAFSKRNRRFGGK